MQKLSTTNFGRQLDYYLKATGKSTYRVAEITGLNHSTIYRLKTGEKSPSPRTVAKIAVALLADDRLLAKDGGLAHILEVLLSAKLDDDIGA